MNSLPGVNETLARLDALENNVRDFAAREEKLESDLRVQTAAELRDFASRNQAQESAAIAQELNAAAAVKTEKDRCQARFERRKAWINRAHAAVSRRVLDKIGEQDVEWKDRTQQGVQAAEIRRVEELANADAAYENFQHELSVAGDGLNQLEASARSAFRGYGRFRRLLAPARPWPEPEVAPDKNVLFAELQKELGKISGDLTRFKKLPLPLVFKFLPIRLVVGVLLGLFASPLLAHLGHHEISPVAAWVSLVTLLVVSVAHLLGGRAAAPLATTIAGELAKARRLFDFCLEKSAAHLQQEQARIKNEFEETKRSLNQEWRQAVKGISHLRGEQPAVMAGKAARVTQKNEQWCQAELERIQQRHAMTMTQWKTTDR